MSENWFPARRLAAVVLSALLVAACRGTLPSPPPTTGPALGTTAPVAASPSAVAAPQASQPVVDPTAVPPAEPAAWVEAGELPLVPYDLTVVPLADGGAIAIGSAWTDDFESSGCIPLDAGHRGVEGDRATEQDPIAVWCDAASRRASARGRGRERRRAVVLKRVHIRSRATVRGLVEGWPARYGQDRPRALQHCLTAASSSLGATSGGRAPALRPRCAGLRRLEGRRRGRSRQRGGAPSISTFPRTAMRSRLPSCSIRIPANGRRRAA